MDDTDRRIVALLQEDARRFPSRTSATTSICRPRPSSGASIGSSHDGVIRGYTAIIDPATYGWSSQAFVDLYCEGGMPGAAIKRAVEGEPGSSRRTPWPARRARCCT